MGRRAESLVIDSLQSFRQDHIGQMHIAHEGASSDGLATAVNSIARAVCAWRISHKRGIVFVIDGDAIVNGEIF